MKMRVKILGLTFASLLLSVGHVQASTWIVSKTGRIKTLTRALTLAQPGDSIIVTKGRYREGHIEVTKSVSIIGRDFPVLDGENKYEIMTVRANKVLLQGLAFENAGISYIQDNAAVKLDSVFDCQIRNNRLTNNFFGIYLARSANILISNNEIKAVARREANSGNGIHLWYCKDILIEKNHISGHRDGIYFEFVEDSNIRENLSENNLRYGLHFMFSHHCRYSENTFRHNGAGVAVMYTKYVEMVGNRFERNWGSASYGILLKEIMDSQIHHNEFLENSIGLYAEGSNRLTIQQNNFVRNGWAIKVMANAMDNVFKNNNFFDNTFDVATNSRQNFNRFERNYWSHYAGYDLDKDGMGDVPYRPVRLFSLIIERQPPALILLRSLFIDLLDLAERAIPVLTPETLIDQHPRMKPVQILKLNQTQASDKGKYHG